MRQVERHGDVAQAAVHADRRRRSRASAVGERVEGQPRPDLAPPARAPAASALRRARASASLPCGRATAIARGDQAPRQLEPVRLGPHLVGARGAVHEGDAASGACIRRGVPALGVQAEVAAAPARS